MEDNPPSVLLAGWCSADRRKANPKGTCSSYWPHYYQRKSELQGLCLVNLTSSPGVSEDNSIPKFIQRDYKVFIPCLLTTSGQFERKSRDPQRIKIDFQSPPLKISLSLSPNSSKFEGDAGSQQEQQNRSFIMTRWSSHDLQRAILLIHPKRVFICPLWPSRQPPD